MSPTPVRPDAVPAATPAARDGERRLPVVVGVVWAVLLTPTAAGVYQQHYPLGWAILGYASVAAFLGAFFYVFARAAAARRRGEPPPCAIRRGGFVVLCVLGTLVVGFAGENGVVVWFALSQIALVLMRPREAWATIGSICVAVVLVPRTLGLDWEVNVWFLVAIFGSSWATDAIFRLRDTNLRLVRAQEQIASMAVEQERLRFARDLHDVVGHSLTAATVKTQLARRLVDTDDDRARAELREVEGLLREALKDVRGTVAGYREVTLPSELVRAATVLEAAGVTADLPRAVDHVPAGRSELFGWVLRESVTNVVRHSHAQYCRVTVTADRIEIWNDGVSGAAHEGSPVSSGLVGLRERVASAGGTLQAGPDGRGGWTVSAMMVA
ncbi:sensor histidine kinase [Jiangella mangrovi]|uniref:Two-component system sensor histidine kinase DesK n=1 Tax=Jiangella mangrovi TaxID=1524084 RepID=A0A7W9GKZ3_9ACTN|nr:sensor histidine kinase [Jiangella mangrovi]MBB5785694.1 two-component system sensor histidine kinase DesK [Jiangella mangrovi]